MATHDTWHEGDPIPLLFFLCLLRRRPTVGLTLSADLVESLYPKQDWLALSDGDHA